MTGPLVTARRPRRLLAGAAMVAGILLVATGLGSFRYGSEGLRRIAVSRLSVATGRPVAIDRLRASLFPTPILAVDGLTIGGQPGDGPPLARIGHATAALRFWPLLRREVDVDALALADVVLRIPPAAPAPAVAPSAAGTPATAPAPTAARLGFTLRRLTATDVDVGWRIAGGRDWGVVLPSLRVDRRADGRAEASADWRVGAAGGAARLLTGPLAADPLGAVPWPLALSSTANGLPVASGMAATAFTVDAPAPPGPIRATATVTAGDLPVRLTATMPDRGSSLTSLGLVLAAEAAGARLDFDGAIDHPAELAGVHGAATLKIPDLSVLWPLAGHPLPAWHGVTAGAQLADRGGLGQGIELHGLKFDLPAADGAGTVGFDYRPPHRVRGAIAFGRLDPEALLRLRAPADPAPAGAPAARPAHRDAFLISDRALNLRGLGDADVDLRASALVVPWHGQEYRRLAVRLVSAGGDARLDPFAVETPAGVVLARVAGRDLSGARPRVALSVRAPDIKLDALLGLLDLPPLAKGDLGIDVALEGAGDSLHALAAGMTGHGAVAMVGGVAGNVALGDLMGMMMSADRVAMLLDGGDVTRIQCLALRVDARDGRGSVPALLLQTKRLLLEGGGTVDFGRETMALQLRPTVQTLLGGISVDAALRGPWRAPKFSSSDDRFQPEPQIPGLTPFVPRDECAGQIAAARDGAAPAPPAGSDFSPP